MSYSKLIHEYLDGQTDMGREDVLFAELASNSDLRIEFNQQVQLQNVAMSDMRTITPPAESTNAVFSSLGFTIPSQDYLNRLSPQTDAGISKKPAAGVAFIDFWKKHVVTVAAILLTAGLTTGVFMVTDDRYMPTETTEQATVASNDIPIVSSEESTPVVVERTVNNNNSSVAAFANNNRNNIIAAASVEEEQNISAQINMSDVVKVNQNNSHNINSGIESFASNIIPSPINPMAEMLGLTPARNFNDGNLAFIVSYPMVSASNISVDNRLISDFETNFSVTTLYKLNDSWYIGAQIGKENFAMNVNRNLVGEQLNYQQNPELWFGGLTLRYTPSIDNLIGIGGISNYIKPYAQLFGGSTNIGGILGNGQVGFTITPVNNWALNFGYEVKTLVYSVDANFDQNTFKNGFTFGAGLSF